MTERDPLYVAMWSGPRNISTAMMRSWGNRPDTFVCDEPFYACFLTQRQNRPSHPIEKEVIAHHETDWRKVVSWLTGEIPEGRSIFYQKQMTHHLMPEIGRTWLGRVTNCFLIRDPREVITSLLKIIPNPTIDDFGFRQQADIFAQARESTGSIPPILDARDVLSDPRRYLGLLCDALNVEFTESMLRWPPGLRPTDGVWAEHWYSAVKQTTSFAPYRSKPDKVPPNLRDEFEQCIESYQLLHPHRLR